MNGQALSIASAILGVLGAIVLTVGVIAGRKAGLAGVGLVVLALIGAGVLSISGLVTGILALRNQGPKATAIVGIVASSALIVVFFVSLIAAQLQNPSPREPVEPMPRTEPPE